MRVCAITTTAPSRADSASSAPITARSRRSRMSISVESRSARPVSTTSWLVAPKCTWRSCGAPTASRSCATSSGTTTPSRAVPAASEAMSGRNRSSAAEIAFAASFGMTPAAASARASAASKPSIARSSASAENSAAASSSPRRPDRSGWSNGETCNGLLRCRRRSFPSPPGDGCRTYRCRRRAAQSASARAPCVRSAAGSGPRHSPFPRRRNTSACGGRY